MINIIAALMSICFIAVGGGYFLEATTDDTLFRFIKMQGVVVADYFAISSIGMVLCGGPLGFLFAGKERMRNSEHTSYREITINLGLSYLAAISVAIWLFTVTKYHITESYTLSSLSIILATCCLFMSVTIGAYWALMLYLKASQKHNIPG